MSKKNKKSRTRIVGTVKGMKTIKAEAERESMQDLFHAMFAACEKGDDSEAERLLNLASKPIGETQTQVFDSEIEELLTGGNRTHHAVEMHSSNPSNGYPWLKDENILNDDSDEDEDQSDEEVDDEEENLRNELTEKASAAERALHAPETKTEEAELPIGNYVKKEDFRFNPINFDYDTGRLDISSLWASLGTIDLGLFGIKMMRKFGPKNPDYITPELTTEFVERLKCLIFKAMYPITVVPKTLFENEFILNCGKIGPDAFIRPFCTFSGSEYVGITVIDMDDMEENMKYLEKYINNSPFGYEMLCVIIDKLEMNSSFVFTDDEESVRIYAPEASKFTNNSIANTYFNYFQQSGDQVTLSSDDGITDPIDIYYTGLFEDNQIIHPDSFDEAMDDLFDDLNDLCHYNTEEEEEEIPDLKLPNESTDEEIATTAGFTVNASEEEQKSEIQVKLDEAMKKFKQRTVEEVREVGKAIENGEIKAFDEVETPEIPDTEEPIEVDSMDMMNFTPHRKP